MLQDVLPIPLLAFVGDSALNIATAGQLGVNTGDVPMEIPLKVSIIDSSLKIERPERGGSISLHDKKGFQIQLSPDREAIRERARSLIKQKVGGTLLTAVARDKIEDLGMQFRKTINEEHLSIPGFKDYTWIQFGQAVVIPSDKKGKGWLAIGFWPIEKPALNELPHLYHFDLGSSGKESGPEYAQKTDQPAKSQ